MRIFGQHGLQIYASEHLTGKHNAHLQNKLYLFLDEAIWAGDKEADRKLKTLTTEKWLMIEPKGINSFQWVNRLGLYMSGNDKWIVPASHDERRYAVNRINERWKQNKSYFTPLFAEIEDGGAGAMLYDLFHLDLDGWHPREHVPQTKALLDQKMLGMTGLEQWYVHLLSVGELPKPSEKNPRWVASKFLIEDAKNHNPRNKYITPDELAEFVKEMGCTHKSNGKAWGWIFPPLAEARSNWLAAPATLGSGSLISRIGDRRRNERQEARLIGLIAVSCPKILGPGHAQRLGTIKPIKPIKHKNRVET